MKKPSVLLGALVSGLLTLPLLAVWFVGERIAGFPFVPFNVFYNVRDNTPGVIITKVIETMESGIRALNLGRVDTVAKQAEMLISIIMILVIMLVAGAILFAVMRRMQHRQRDADDQPKNHAGQPFLPVFQPPHDREEDRSGDHHDHDNHNDA